MYIACMNVCHIYWMYVCVYVCMSYILHMCVCVCVCVCMHVCMCVCMCVCMHVIYIECVCVCVNVCMYVCHIHTSSVTGVRGLQVVVRSISPVCVCVCVCVCAPVTFIFFPPLPPRSPSVLSLILFYCFNLSLCYFIIFLFNSPSDPRFCFSLFLYLPLPVTHGSVSPHAIHGM